MPRRRAPIFTTSRLLSTGVDAQTCRLIVLDREVGSMTEFKQIVGRGTRVHEDTKKYYFTLIDFRKATNHFADPDFDGEPVQMSESLLIPISRISRSHPAGLSRANTTFMAMK